MIKKYNSLLNHYCVLEKVPEIALKYYIFILLRKD